MLGQDATLRACPGARCLIQTAISEIAATPKTECPRTVLRGADRRIFARQPQADWLRAQLKQLARAGDHWNRPPLRRPVIGGLGREVHSRIGGKGV
jgi:hypothetical protein